MADPASGPTSLLHSADCPGCAADRTLTHEDKTFLDSHGWKHPGHTIMPPPPDPDPPRYRSHQEATQLLVRRLLLAAVGVLAFGAGLKALGPWFVPVLLVATAAWVHHLLHRRAQHAQDHLAPGGHDPLCRLCRRAKAREAARQSAHDQRLATADAAARLRETNAAHFQRLLHEDRKRRGLV
jgi:hypothetical protein